MSDTLQYAFHKVKRMASSNKQPISLLQEALVSSRCVPNYELIDTSGEPHIRTFTYRAFINDEVSATASESTKKGAKTAAALALVHLICGLADESNEATGSNHYDAIDCKTDNATSERGASPAATITSSYVNGITSENHIGTLQEMGVIRGWGMPQYVEESRDGESHMPIFRTSCTLLQFKTVGEAGNKKAAKKLAALKMLELVKQSLVHEPQQQPVVIAPPPYDTNFVQPDVLVKTEVKDEHTDVILPHKSEIAAGMYQEVLTNVQEGSILSTTPEMLKLKIIGICRGTDHLQTLRELCQEQSIGLTITQLEDLNDDEDHQALVQLDFSVRGMETFVVCLGAGQDWKLAEASAARNALEYIKLVARGYKVKSIQF